MGSRIAFGVWGLLGTVALAVVASGGQVSTADVLNGVAAAIVFVALWGVVKLPWDLYFAARHVQRAQQDSRRRGVQVGAGEEAEASGLARRLLALAVGLHLLGALVSGLASIASGGRLGLFAAGAFLVTLAVRPTGAMFVHVQARLRDLQRRARVPQDDALALHQRLQEAEGLLEQLGRRLEEAETGLTGLTAEVGTQRSTLERGLARQEERHLHELDRLGTEMQRSLEKLSDDQELLAGLRAFLKLVKSS